MRWLGYAREAVIFWVLDHLATRQPAEVEVTVREFMEMRPGDRIVTMTNNPDLPITVRRVPRPGDVIPGSRTVPRGDGTYR